MKISKYLIYQNLKIHIYGLKSQILMKNNVHCCFDFSEQKHCIAILKNEIDL